MFNYKLLPQFSDRSNNGSTFMDNEDEQYLVTEGSDRNGEVWNDENLSSSEESPEEINLLSRQDYRTSNGRKVVET